MPRFNAGDVVPVYNHSFSGRPVTEGRAKIVCALRQPELYKLIFLDDEYCVQYTRTVSAGLGQTDPERFIEAVTKDWEHQNPDIASKRP
jgi:hypothetical protein